MLVMPRMVSARSGSSRIARVVLAMLSAPRFSARVLGAASEGMSAERAPGSPRTRPPPLAPRIGVGALREEELQPKPTAGNLLDALAFRFHAVALGIVDDATPFRDVVIIEMRSRRIYAERQSPGAQAPGSSPAASRSRSARCRSFGAGRRSMTSSPHRTGTACTDPKERLLTVGVPCDLSGTSGGITESVTGPRPVTNSGRVESA
jgi:hypothetical protein